MEAKHIHIMCALNYSVHTSGAGNFFGMGGGEGHQ